MHLGHLTLLWGNYYSFPAIIMYIYDDAWFDLTWQWQWHVKASAFMTGGLLLSPRLGPFAERQLKVALAPCASGSSALQRRMTLPTSETSCPVGYQSDAKRHGSSCQLGTLFSF